VTEFEGALSSFAAAAEFKSTAACVAQPVSQVGPRRSAPRPTSCRICRRFGAGTDQHGSKLMGIAVDGSPAIGPYNRLGRAQYRFQNASRRFPVPISDEILRALSPDDPCRIVT
jgi:hypothetical protein